MGVGKREREEGKEEGGRTCGSHDAGSKRQKCMQPTGSLGFLVPGWAAGHA